ncbi:HEAT repeat domain-containing protein [Tautonia marina]|uniref:HEAT repeat domain-containing protein n=1 Tax=Tautonia marina TaxID=2653855 RepID=UPI00126127E7|nr:hypothetical protein [Tautonia marina]
MILVILALVSVPEVLPSSVAQEVLPVTVEEWSIWVGSPAQERINDRNAAGNAMPSVVGTARPKQENPGPWGLPIAPVSVVRFLGKPIEDFDLEIRLSSGTFLSHWPPARERVDSLRWFGANLSQNPPADHPLVFLSESHPFRALRELDDSLVIEVEGRAERFLAYDAELALPIPLTLQDGPDDYTLQNLSFHSLHDLAVIVPTDGGYRIGWLDELPAEQPQSSEEPIKEDNDSDSESNAQDDSNRDPALDVFDDENGDDPESRATPPPSPVPAEADAAVRARIEQRLNQSVTLNGSARPVADVLQLIRNQTGLQTVRDDRTLADAEIDLDTTPADLTAGIRPARDVLADMLGKSGLSYRITEDGSLFLSTSERLEAASDASPAQVKGPPVTLTLSDVFTDSDPAYAEVSARELLRRLVSQGIREDRARTTLDELGDHLFRPDRLIVLAHLDRAAIDELVPLDVFPPVDRTVRVATVIISGIDPSLSDQAALLVPQLGDPSPSVREAAERELLTLGPVAIPALKTALDHQDLEIVYRAERILRQLDQPIP